MKYGMKYAEKRPLLFMVVLILSSMSICTAQDISISNKVTYPTDGTIWVTDSTENPKEATVSLTVTDEVNKVRDPITLVMAIDCSGSMSGSDPRENRIEAAKRFVDLMAVDNVNDKFGVVLWDDRLVDKLEPTDDIELVKGYIEKAEASGGTCLWEALNESDVLLEDATTEEKVVLLFSDGKDECDRALDFVAKAREMRSNGITIYTIGLGNSQIADLQAIGQYFHVSKAEDIGPVFEDVVAVLKTSLENVEATYILPNGIEAFAIPPSVSLTPDANGDIINWDIGPMYHTQTKTISFKAKSEYPGTYRLAMPSESVVTYSKLDGSSGAEDIPAADLEIEMLSQLFYNGMAKGGKVSDTIHSGYTIEVSKDIVRGEVGCQDIVINITTPEIPCNRVVVFAVDSSGSTLQNGYEGPMMGGIEDALKKYHDIKYARVDWDYKLDYSSPDFQLGSYWSYENTSHRLSLSEYEGTVYAEGLNSALEKLNHEKERSDEFDKITTAWLVIFLTGKSEFVPGNLPTVVGKAVDYEIPVYTIGLDIYEGSPDTGEEASVLKYEISRPTGGEFYSASSKADVENRVNLILSEACEGIDVSAKPVAGNMTVVDTIYGYFKVVGTEPDKTTIKYPDDPYGPTTVIFDVGDVPAATKRTLVIHTDIDFTKLPIDVTKERTRVDFSPAASSPFSEVIYTHMVNGTIRRRPLPEGELTIFCGEPCPDVQEGPSAPAELTETTPIVDGVSNEPEKQPGFEAVLAIVGLLLSIYIKRKR